MSYPYNFMISILEIFQIYKLWIHHICIQDFFLNSKISRFMTSKCHIQYSSQNFYKFVWICLHWVFFTSISSNKLITKDHICVIFISYEFITKLKYFKKVIWKNWYNSYDLSVFRIITNMLHFWCFLFFLFSYCQIKGV